MQRRKGGRVGDDIESVRFVGLLAGQEAGRADEVGCVLCRLDESRLEVGGPREAGRIVYQIGVFVEQRLDLSAAGNGVCE